MASSLVFKMRMGTTDRRYAVWGGDRGSFRSFGCQCAVRGWEEHKGASDAEAPARGRELSGPAVSESSEPGGEASSRM